MITLAEPHKQMIKSTSLAIVYAWEITRVDGVILRFTSGDGELTIDGNLYSPVDGYSGSALEKQSGLKEENTTEYRGILSSGAIDDDEIRAGEYRDATIRENVIDLRFPWLGVIYYQEFYVIDMMWTGEFWRAQIGGKMSKLRGAIGGTYTRICRYDLGDSQCQAALAPQTFTSYVTAVIVPRLNFRSSSVDSFELERNDLQIRKLQDKHLGANAGRKNLRLRRRSLLPSVPNQHYKYATITWLTGNNAGLKSEVKRYFGAASAQFALRLRTPYDIAIGDQYTVHQGCNKTRDHCENLFNNIVNYGGYPFIPGADATNEGPILS